MSETNDQGRNGTPLQPELDPLELKRHWANECKSLSKSKLLKLLSELIQEWEALQKESAKPTFLAEQWARKSALEIKLRLAQSELESRGSFSDWKLALYIIIGILAVSLIFWLLS